MTGAAFRGAEGRTEKLKAAVPAERGAEFLARLVLLFGYEAPAVSGTPAAFRAGAAKPRLFLRFGEAETQGVRTAAGVAKVGESTVGGLNICDRGGVSRGGGENGEIESRSARRARSGVPCEVGAFVWV